MPHHVFSMLAATVFSLVSGGFIQTPVSINATLGSTVQFKCQIESGQLYWLLNGNELWRSSNSDRQARAHTQNYVLSTLTIPALMINDNITIHCVIHPNTLTEPAVLRVQGIPAAVKNLSVVLKIEHISIISWEPPEMLDLTYNDSEIILYIVTIRNFFSGYESSHSINETKFVFQQHGVEECTPYEIIVQAVNVVGIGTSNGLDFQFSGPSLEVNVQEHFQTNQAIVSVTCTAFENSCIVWNIYTDSIHSRQPLLGKFLTLHQHNPLYKQYSETVYLNSELYQHYQSVNVSLQCVEMRVCSSSDSPYTCVTSHCRSNNVSLPSMLLHEAPTSELHEPTTTNSSIMAMTVNDSMSTAMIDNHRSYQCERIVIGFSISLGSFVFLVLAAALFALCFHHKRKPRTTTKQCNSKEDRIYASVLSIPGLLHHHPSPTLVNTQECPAYEVQKLN